MSRLSAAAMSALLNPAGSIAASKTVSNVTVSGGVVTVASTAHGYSAGDIFAGESIGGAVEVNGIHVVDTVPDANSLTVRGLAAITAYTSGGTMKKLTFTAGLVRALTATDIAALRDALNRVPDAPATALSAIFTEGRVF